MSRLLFSLIFAIGLCTVAWVGIGFVGSSALALVMTVVIAGVYLAGAWELTLFRRATASLRQAIASLVSPAPNLETWIAQLPSALQHTVRLRVEGERVALPAPALTPYLVGLLVMLGMLGTFLGMVITFKGAVFALEGSADLQAIRAALAAPIKGLGLSFGTSVAGVAASAMLGLLSALSRRGRLQVSRQLDTLAATTWRAHSRAFQREESLKALKLQGQALPQAMERLHVMVQLMEQRELAQNAAMSHRQTLFHQEVSSAYTQLAESVGQSMRTSLAQSAQQTAHTVGPILESAMQAMSLEIQRQHHGVGETVRAQLTQVATDLGATARTTSDTLAIALANQARENETLVSNLGRTLEDFTQRWSLQGDALLSNVQVSATQAQAQHNAADRERLQTWTQVLESSATTLHGEWKALGAQTRTAQQAACEIMQSCAAELTRLGARDHRNLQDQANLLEHLQAVAEATRTLTDGQRSSMADLLATTHGALGSASSEFVQLLDTQSKRSGEVAVHVHSSAIELASLGEALQVAVAQFAQANDRMTASLQRVEGAVTQSMERSDEQLAYYVAQAREVIDLSLSSQRAVIEDLRSLRGKPMVSAEAPA